MCGCPAEGKTYDAENFLVCPDHGQREYGWRSGELVQTANGRRPAYHHPPDFKPDLELEVTVEDRRENTDAMAWVEEREVIQFTNGNGHIPPPRVRAERTDLSHLQGAPVAEQQIPFRENLFRQEYREVKEEHAA